MIEPTTSLSFESEHAREQSAIEWWFVQGHYGTRSWRRRFMATLFRANVEVDAGETTNGYQLLLTLLDEDGTAHRTSTWIDPNSVRAAVYKLERTEEAHIDRAVQSAITRELRRGPLLPVVLHREPVHFRADPLTARWGNFAIAQNDGGFTLGFTEPADGARVELRLEPDAPVLEIDVEAPGVKDMAYRCYPRLSVTGSADGEALEGAAWLDHQWGDAGWFWDSQREVFLGWDWFGVNLDDGTDWVLMRHWDARTGETFASHATVRTDAGPRISHTLHATPTRWWECPRTRISHPVEWRLEAPEMDAVFTFEPLADDQEVASFGAARALWQGAGTVTGTVAGRPVSGRARGELHGYGYVFDYGDYLAAMGRRVDRHLEAIVPRRFEIADVERFVGPAHGAHEPDAYTRMISTPVWDLIDRSGKRWRPIFAILLAESLGVESSPYERLVCGMTELMHSGALIVDDIEDASELRRGAPALHLEYGLDVALNAANALYFLPSTELFDHPLLSPEQRLRMHEIKERVCIEAHCGQATDIYWSRRLSTERLAAWLDDDLDAKVLQMYDLKTGAGARGLAASVALVARADEALTRACIEFARAFAVAFQVTDDVLNFSGSERWTKVPGEDLLQGKLTYVIATALRRLDRNRAGRLGEILCSPPLRSTPDGLAEGIDLVRDSGALEACREHARTMTADAWDAFSRHFPPSEPKVMLHAMCLRTIDLAYDA